MTNFSLLPDTYQLSLSFSSPSPPLTLFPFLTHTQKKKTLVDDKLHISLTLKIWHLKISINKNILAKTNKNKLYAMSADGLHSQHILFLRGASTRFQVMASSSYGTSHSRSLDTPHSVGLLWTSDQPDAKICTRQHSQHTSMPPAGSEPAIPGSARPRVCNKL